MSPMLCCHPEVEDPSEYNPWPSFKYTGKLRPFPTVSASSSPLQVCMTIHTHVRACNRVLYTDTSVVCIATRGTWCTGDATMSVPAASLSR